jgi:protocatechuate 3,4-dioxygenase beta subunit
MFLESGRAQTTFGQIVGTVTDATAAPVPDAQVTVTNLGTAERRVMKTSPDGLYQFVNLIPGEYKIEIEKTGFSRATRDGVRVETQSTAKIDVSLQIGDVSQSVEVTAQTPLLAPDTSSLGQVVDQRKTNELH